MEDESAGKKPTFVQTNAFAMSLTPLLKISRLQVSFLREGKWNKAVDGIDLEIFKGQTLGLVGESGSGKSVSSLAIMRLLDQRNSRVTAEEMLLNGKPMTRLGEKQMQQLRGKQIAMIFQEPMTSLNPVFRCGFQVAEAILAHEPVSKKQAYERVLSLFRQVKLPRPEAIWRAYPHELSGGQKQRVMIAMAIACNPDLLIADEPTTALDVTVQKEILLLLKQLQQETGMSMIFITHDLAVIAEIADTVAVMHQGKVVESGPVDQVMQHPQHPYTSGLLACRPPLHVRLKRLPVVKEFLNDQWPGGSDQIISELQLTPAVRKERHHQLYAQDPLLRVEKLSTWYPLRKGIFGRVYDHVKAVDEVSFEVYPGETLGLVGESGCGKTTLGRSILRLHEPTSGRVFYDGIEVTSLNHAGLRALRQKMQIVFQDPYSSLNPRLTIGSAIAEPMLVHKLQTNEHKRRDRVCELLEQVGLEAAHFGRYPHEFSGGQRQRICIARALAVSPQLIICDESVSALDVSVQAQVLNLLNDLKRTFGFTYIFISHDLSVVRFMSDRVLVMNHGRMEELHQKTHCCYTGAKRRSFRLSFVKDFYF
jgi:peptide/nickel transport system ATP-binding protein